MHVNIRIDGSVIHHPRFTLAEDPQGQKESKPEPEARPARSPDKAAARDPLTQESSMVDCLRYWKVISVVSQEMASALRRTTLSFSERAPGGRGDQLSATNLRLPLARLPGLPGEVSIGRSLGTTVLGLDSDPCSLGMGTLRGFCNLNFDAQSLGIWTQVHLSHRSFPGCSLGFGFSDSEQRHHALIANVEDNLGPKAHLWLKSLSCSSGQLILLAGFGTTWPFNVGLRGRLDLSRSVELTVQRLVSPLEAVSLDRHATCSWRQRLRQAGALGHRILFGSPWVSDLARQVADLNVNESLLLSRAQAPRRRWTSHLRFGWHTGTRLQQLSAGPVCQGSLLSQVFYHLRQDDHDLLLTVVEKVQSGGDMGVAVPTMQRGQVSLDSRAPFAILRLPIAAGDMRAAAGGKGATAPAVAALTELLKTLERPAPRLSSSPVTSILAWQAQHQHLGIGCVGQGEYKGAGHSRRLEGHIPILTWPGAARARRTVQQHHSEERQVLTRGSCSHEEEIRTVCTLLELANCGEVRATSRVQHIFGKAIAGGPADVVSDSTIYSCALWLERPLLREVNRLCLQPMATTLSLRQPPTVLLDEAAAQLRDPERRIDASLALDATALETLRLALLNKNHIKCEETPHLLEHATTEPLRDLFRDLYAEVQSAGNDRQRAYRALQDRLDQFFLLESPTADSSRFFLPTSPAADNTLFWPQLRVLSSLAELTGTVGKSLNITCSSALESEEGTAAHNLWALVSDPDAIAQRLQLYAGAAHLLPQALSAWHRQQLGFIVGQQRMFLPHAYRQPNQQDAQQQELLHKRLTGQGATLAAALGQLTARIDSIPPTSRLRGLGRLHGQLRDAAAGSDPVDERVLSTMIDSLTARIHLEKTQVLVRDARTALHQALDRHLSHPHQAQPAWYQRVEWQPRNLTTQGLIGLASAWLPRCAVEELMGLSGHCLTLANQTLGHFLLARAFAEADLDIWRGPPNIKN